MELQLIGLVEVFKSGQKLPPEPPAQSTHREKIMRGRTYPARAVQGHAAAGDDAVQVIMIQQGLAPGVQDGGEAQLRLDPPGAKLPQPLAAATQDQLEKTLPF